MSQSMDTMDEQQSFRPGAASLLDDLDKRLLLILRDGRHLVGKLRSFDQYMNLILEDTCERMIGNGKYADRLLGLHIVRGDSIVLLGQIDTDEVDAQEQANKGLIKITPEEFYELDIEDETTLDWDFD